MVHVFLGERMAASAATRGPETLPEARTSRRWPCRERTIGKTRISSEDGGAGPGEESSGRRLRIFAKYKRFGSYDIIPELVNWSALSSEELIRACVNSGDTGAWEEFVRRFRPVIACTVMRTARRFGEGSPELIEDLVQDTYLKICSNRCRILREFQPEAPEAIFGLLKMVALSVTQDYFRGRLAGKRHTGWREVALDIYAGSAQGREGLPQAEREVLMRQIDEQLPAASEPATRERDRQIFWLYYRHGMTTRAIAGIPAIGLTQKGVESAIQRLTNHVRTRLAEKPGPPEGKSSELSL